MSIEHHLSEKSQDKPKKMWRYQVTATLKDSEAIKPYLEWLFAGHVAAVCEWAESAELVQITSITSETPHQVMSIYWFESPQAFERYEREGAPALRAEGVELASRLGGITFERSFGWSWMIGNQV